MSLVYTFPHAPPQNSPDASTPRTRSEMNFPALNILGASSEIVPTKPWQRLAASLHATGTPLYDIAPHVLQSVEAISYFITSPQGQQLISTILGENQARLNDLLEACAVDSLLVLIRIRDNPQSKQSEKIAACKELLSRTLPGVKATESKPREGSKHSHDPAAEIARLEAQIANI